MLQNFIEYRPQIFQKIDFKKLDREIEWEQHNCQIMGKTISLPRLTKFYSYPEGKTYKYTGTYNQGSSFESSPTLNQIFQKVSNEYQVNVCLLNRYQGYFFLTIIHQEINFLAQIRSPFKRTYGIRQIIYYLAIQE